MYIFSSVVVIAFALYYFTIMTDAYTKDTSYIAPLVVLIIYALWSFIREFNKEDDSNYWTPNYNKGKKNYWCDDYYGDNFYSGSYNYGCSRKSTNYTVDKGFGGRTVENFTPDKKIEKDNVKELTHYPTRNEVREKIKELEKNPWFKFKKDVADVFAVDITQKYYDKYSKPYKVYKKGVVTPINKEDNTRFMPPVRTNQAELDEYNKVTKFVGRSFEVALSEEIK